MPGIRLDSLLLHLDGAHDAAWNMAADQAWLECAPQPVLRVYAWDRPSLSLGYAQNVERLAPQMPAGWARVRRWSGGGVVLHGPGEFTYALSLPAGHPLALMDAAQSYRLVHESLARALNAAGCGDFRLAQAEDLVEGAFCFEAPALHDVLGADGRKVSGAAQRRGPLGLLHQGSIQQVTVPPLFWRQWAEALAAEVHDVGLPPPRWQRRARQLQRHRYALPQWLQEREDELRGLTPAHEAELVFVYGTLRRGQCNHHWMGHSPCWGEASTEPAFAVHELGGYPGMVRDGLTGEPVRGELYLVDSATLQGLDELEDVAGGEYAREVLPMAEPWRHFGVQGYLYLRSVQGCPRLRQS